jgi:hypothetical protein
MAKATVVKGTSRYTRKEIDAGQVTAELLDAETFYDATERKYRICLDGEEIGTVWGGYGVWYFAYPDASHPLFNDRQSRVLAIGALLSEHQQGR